jgi:hypothetical protein
MIRTIKTVSLAIVLTWVLEACNERVESNKRHAEGGSDSAIDGIYRKAQEFAVPYTKSQQIQRIDCATLKDREIPKDLAHCYRMEAPENVVAAYANVVERILAKKDLSYEYVGYLGGPVRDGVDDGIETMEVNTVWLGPGFDESRNKRCFQIRDSLVGFISRLKWKKLKGEENYGDTDEDLSPVTTPAEKLKEDHPLQPGQEGLAVEFVTLSWMKFNNIFRVYPIDEYSRSDAYKFTSDVAVQAGISHLVEGDKFKVKAGRALAVTVCDDQKPVVEDGGIIFFVERLPHAK